MADLICDTNVFYNIAAGTVNPAAIKAAGHRLLLTPVTVLELISHITDRDFGIRQAAARAALQHTDELLRDPETLLAEIWGLPPEPQNVDWFDGLRALDGSAGLAALGEGVPDFGASLVRRVDVPLARMWRGGHYDDFEQDMIAAADQYVPGYATSRASGRLRNATAAQRHAALTAFSDEQAGNVTLLATRLRAWLGREGDLPPATEEEMTHASALLDAYCRVYRRYFLDVVTTAYAPQPNDFGDLECFVYLRENRLVATSEVRWHDVSTRAGLSGAVVDPKNF